MSLTPPTWRDNESEEVCAIVRESLKLLPDSPEFRRLRRKVISHPSNLVRAASLLMLDLADQGHLLRVWRGMVQFSSLSTNAESDATIRIRRRLHSARAYQLRSSAVREFLAMMEKRRLHKDRWTSIFSLMRDGAEFSQKLESFRRGESGIDAVMKPYIQVVDSEGVCEFTGLSLMNIWRYFRHTWANPYQSVPGRSFLLLVRDASVQNHPVIGIASLASSAVQLAVRDEWIGWTPDTVVTRLRESATVEDIEWLDRTIDGGLREIYVEDLFDPTYGPMRPKHFRKPTADIIRWLQERAAEQRLLHEKSADSKQHKQSAVDKQGDDFWIRQAETPLFRSKRCEVLATFLRAKLALRNSAFKLLSPVQLRERLGSPDYRQDLLSLIRRIKSERVGVSIADISVCGAIAPYSAVTGGKLVALLLMSPEVLVKYAARYGGAESIIASSVAGRSLVRPPHLVFLGTTSLYGSEPNQYTRVSLPCSVIGGAPDRSLKYVRLGQTEGYGTFQFSDETVDALSALVAEYRGGRRVNSIFGEGVNPRLRKIRDGFDLLGLDSDRMLMHGNARLIYGVALASNYSRYLLGLDAVPTYPFTLGEPAESTNKIAAWWVSRWLLKRIQRDDILREIASHRLTYPIRHGARVDLTADDDEQMSLGEVLYDNG